LSLANVVRRNSSRDEPRLRRSDAPLLLGVIFSGGMLGPFFMLAGLERVSAVSGSLLLNVEAPLFAAALMGLGVWLLLREKHEHLHDHEGLEHDQLHAESSGNS
jgi:drug/metabolite transporter (DMT)-like permease